MASAQVLSNSSRKQEHLEAGKRRLEEFRKKKAAAKKAVLTNQPRTADSTTIEKQASENGQAPFAHSASPAAFGRTDAVTGTSRFLGHIDKAHGFAHDSESESVPQANESFQSNHCSSSDLLQMLPNRVGDGNDSSDLEYRTGPTYPQQTDQKIGMFETDTGERRFAASGRASVFQDGDGSNFNSNFYGVDKDFSSSVKLPNSNDSAKEFAAKVYSDGHVTNLLHHESDSVHSSTEFQASTLELDHDKHGVPAFKNSLTFDLDYSRPSDAVGNLWAFASQRESEPSSESFNSNISGSFNGLSSSAVAETYPRRSRPSFLDSLNIGRDSPASVGPFPVKERFTNSKLPGDDFGVSSVIQDFSLHSAPVEPLPTPASSNRSNDFFGNAFREQKIFENSLESKLEFPSRRQNEDFAALEQHIEDLTQEKFSLQRALEASKALSESLASENSSLTDSYNQQASIVNQLKVEMEGLQEEIKSRLVELEAFKAEYTNAQLECNAADERAKLLASEVISLEEKALRLRSNELKLERELEISSAEITSYKRKLSSLEKERRDLQQTIDALQEEKKLLQSKLRRASSGGISIDLKKGHPKKDASTSTNYLGPDTAGENPEEAASNMQIHNDTENLLLLRQNGSAGFEDVAMNIPPDQVQMIQNINSLISEITSEKEELMQALINEVSTSTKLKDLNKELSRKLEVQTQRLELLTAQSMASENVSARQPTGTRIVRETVAYADEGDEVVERVLGWIMKLFPGGPSKRRTSRL